MHVLPGGMRCLGSDPVRFRPVSAWRCRGEQVSLMSFLLRTWFVVLFSIAVINNWISHEYVRTPPSRVGKGVLGLLVENKLPVQSLDTPDENVYRDLIKTFDLCL